jgi:general secretion pathway protein M
MLVYALLIDPALMGRAKLKHDLPELHQQVAQMQALSKKISALAVKATPTAETVTREKIDETLARYSLTAQNILLTGEYVKVQLTAMPFSDTLAWIEELQKSMRLSVVDADFVALDKADMADIKLTLRQARNE